MSKRYDTNYNRQQRLIATVKDLFQCAECFHYDLQTICARRQERLYDTNDWRRSTAAIRGYVEGYFDCLWEGLYRYKLEFRHLLDGKWMSADEVKEALTNGNRSWKEVQKGAHFWKGTDRQFNAKD